MQAFDCSFVPLHYLFGKVLAFNYMECMNFQVMIVPFNSSYLEILFFAVYRFIWSEVRPLHSLSLIWKHFKAANKGSGNTS